MNDSLNNSQANSITLKVRAISSFILMMLFPALFFLLAYKGYNNQNIDLTKLNTFTGEIESVGEKINTSSKKNSTVFFVKLVGLQQKLGVYRMKGDYGSLLNKLYLGDTITVYYKEQDPCDVNTDLVQITKNEAIILNQDEYNKKQIFLIWIGLGGGISLIIYSIFYFRKYILVLF